MFKNEEVQSLVLERPGLYSCETLIVGVVPSFGRDETREFFEGVNRVARYKEDCLLLTPSRFKPGRKVEPLFFGFENSFEEAGAIHRKVDCLSYSINSFLQGRKAMYYEMMTQTFLEELKNSTKKVVVALTDDPVFLKGPKGGSLSTITLLAHSLMPSRLHKDFSLTHSLSGIRSGNGRGLVYSLDCKKGKESIKFTS